jgi:hypothetical protein
MSHKKVSSGLFGLAVIFFILPFITVSCGGQLVLTLNGVQLVTGTSAPTGFPNDPDSRIDPEPLVQLTLLCALVGLVLSAFGQFISWRQARACWASSS